MKNASVAPAESCFTGMTAHDSTCLGHELRNPLTSLKGALDLLAAGILGPAPQPLQPLIAAARQNTHHFADLLDVYLPRPTSGQWPSGAVPPGRARCRPASVLRQPRGQRARKQ